MQNQHDADAIYEEQVQERNQYYNRYQDAGASANNDITGYAADFDENYGDETDYNIESDANQMNFISSR